MTCQYCDDKGYIEMVFKTRDKTETKKIPCSGCPPMKEPTTVYELYENFVAQDLYTYDKAQDRPIKVRPFPQSVKEQDQ